MGSIDQDITPDDTTDRWFHENTLTIRADSVFIDKVPVSFGGHMTKGSKQYSASDGGFYTYRGKIRRLRSGQLSVRILLVGHDYVLAPYSLKNQADTAFLKTMDEATQQARFKEFYVPDSSFWKREFPLLSRGNTLVLDSVTYYRQPANQPLKP
ncbi:hypothetical protein [Hymenobacter terrestris]|uniref:Uncharacterized protein n=1 Tax=Hymenobacter terrestris TaxID=2748310 RepID=A0ABX2Q4F4_9BACT|nr:hypothetical protein [Hymenobacter terrestris]NVO85301.1 hypothetical protein [Hymenobacter terrestris]